MYIADYLLQEKEDIRVGLTHYILKLILLLFVYLGIKSTKRSQVCFCSNCKSRWIRGRSLLIFPLYENTPFKLF